MLYLRDKDFDKFGQSSIKSNSSLDKSPLDNSPGRKTDNFSTLAVPPLYPLPQKKQLSLNSLFEQIEVPSDNSRFYLPITPIIPQNFSKNSSPSFDKKYSKTFEDLPSSTKYVNKELFGLDSKIPESLNRSAIDRSSSLFSPIGQLQENLIKPQSILSNSQLSGTIPRQKFKSDYQSGMQTPQVKFDLEKNTSQAVKDIIFSSVKDSSNKIRTPSFDNSMKIDSVQFPFDLPKPYDVASSFISHQNQSQIDSPRNSIPLTAPIPTIPLPSTNQSDQVLPLIAPLPTLTPISSIIEQPQKSLFSDAFTPLPLPPTASNNQTLSLPYFGLLEQNSMILNLLNDMNKNLEKINQRLDKVETQQENLQKTIQTQLQGIKKQTGVQQNFKETVNARLDNIYHAVKQVKGDLAQSIKNIKNPSNTEDSTPSTQFSVQQTPQTIRNTSPNPQSTTTPTTDTIQKIPFYNNNNKSFSPAQFQSPPVVQSLKDQFIKAEINLSQTVDNPSSDFGPFSDNIWTGRNSYPQKLKHSNSGSNLLHAKGMNTVDKKLKNSAVESISIVMDDYLYVKEDLLSTFEEILKVPVRQYRLEDCPISDSVILVMFYSGVVQQNEKETFKAIRSLEIKSAKIPLRILRIGDPSTDSNIKQTNIRSAYISVQKFKFNIIDHFATSCENVDSNNQINFSVKSALHLKKLFSSNA